MFKNKWLTDEPAELFVCHGGDSGGSSGGTAGSYSDAVTANETNPGLGLGYPSTDASGVYGGGEGSIGGGGLGGAISSFDSPAYAYAYAPDFSITNPHSFTAPSQSNFGFGIADSMPSDFSVSPANAYEGAGIASPANFGFTSDFGVDADTWLSDVTPNIAPDVAPAPSSSGGGGGSLAGGGTGFTGGQQGGPPADYGMIGGPTGGVGSSGIGTGEPGLARQLASMGWEGFQPYGPVPGMSSLNSWRGPQGQIHPLADFIRAGWANQRLYTPEYLADTFTDVGTSPRDAYEQLAERGHVPSPSYAGIENLNQLGGVGPVFPSPYGDGTQRFPGVNPITLGPDGQLSDLAGVLPPLTPRQAALLGIK